MRDNEICMLRISDQKPVRDLVRMCLIPREKCYTFLDLMECMQPKNRKPHDEVFIFLHGVKNKLCYIFRQGRKCCGRRRNSQKCTPSSKRQPPPQLTSTTWIKKNKNRIRNIQNKTILCRVFFFLQRNKKISAQIQNIIQRRLILIYIWCIQLSERHPSQSKYGMSQPKRISSVLFQIGTYILS